MLLFEAKAQIDERLKITDYKEQIPEYYNALEIASKSIEAQIRLAELLNDFIATYNKENRYSEDVVIEFLNEIRFDYQEDEYGQN